MIRIAITFFLLGYSYSSSTDFPENILGGGWTLVRRVKAGNSWHPSTDQLTGTESYGTYVNDPTADATFSSPFDIHYVTEFLFATGDGQKWLVASKDAVIGSFYSNALRTITASSVSETSYSARWYRRQGHNEDPWISLSDHRPSIGDGDILYGGAGFGGTHASTVLPVHNGANVFVRFYDDCLNPTTKHGQTQEVIRYDNEVVNAPDLCNSEVRTRTCDDGTWGQWSGSYTYEQCVVNQMCSGNVVHGTIQTRTRYDMPEVNAPVVCTSQTQTRTCSDGIFSGWSGSYTYENCIQKTTTTTTTTTTALTTTTTTNGVFQFSHKGGWKRRDLVPMVDYHSVQFHGLDGKGPGHMTFQECQEICLKHDCVQIAYAEVWDEDKNHPFYGYNGMNLGSQDNYNCQILYKSSEGARDPECEDLVVLHANTDEGPCVQDWWHNFFVWKNYVLAAPTTTTTTTTTVPTTTTTTTSASIPKATGYTARPGYEPHGGWVHQNNPACYAPEGCIARPYANFNTDFCSQLNTAVSPMACKDGPNFWDDNTRCVGTGAMCQTQCNSFSSVEFFSEAAVQYCANLCDAQADCNSFLMVEGYNWNCLLSSRGLGAGVETPSQYRTGWCDGEFKKFWYTKGVASTTTTMTITTTVPTTTTTTTSETTAGPPTTSTTSPPPTAAKFLLMVEGFHGSPYDAVSDEAKNQKAVIVDHVDYVLNRLKNGERR